MVGIPHFFRGVVGQFDDQYRFGDGCGFRLPIVIGLLHLTGLGFSAPIQFIHIPQHGAQLIHVVLIQISNGRTISIARRLRRKDRQDILPCNGIAAIVGLDLLAVIFYTVFDFF